jgi:hypothetical protein
LLFFAQKPDDYKPRNSGRTSNHNRNRRRFGKQTLAHRRLPGDSSVTSNHEPTAHQSSSKVTFKIITE